LGYPPEFKINRRCRARVEASVCCTVVPCRLLCGAVFHLCKEEDHLLLCPNVRVPCLNAEYGCPVQLSRSSQAAHLQVCPASVVCCSMEWNRWPANDAHSYPNTELHENLLREREQGGCLDLAMALKDQDRLFHSMKMKKLFPELIQSVEEEEKEEERMEEERKEKEKQKKAIDVDVEYQPVLTQEEREAIARSAGVDTSLLENYTAWERMFSMEMDAADSCMGATASNNCKQASSACMATSSSSSPSSSCTRKKKFVYGYLEPMKIITVRTFKVPTSFSARQSRIRNPGFYKRENQAVDTSDLGVAQEEMPASLLCSLEKEQRGHLIAESICTDGLLQDEGTQTYSFLSAPFRRNTSLADLTAGKPLELHLQLQVESVTSRHHKASSAFTFLCGHTFQRREYGKHYKWGFFLCCFFVFAKYLRFFSFKVQPSRTRGGEDSLSSLPYEVLCHMASFLDSLSLSQLALVSQLMRQVCSSLLQERGMVTLHWERKTYSHGRAKWRVKHKVWQFSNLFSPVDTWCFQDVLPISEHLKVCPHYERESRTEKIHLPRIRDEDQTNTGCKGPTLVSLFQQKRIMM
uniref:F-box protein 40 n=1 Tax=Lates calcarifer TaxID=8187 RepID=A0A4W6F394_LATCA